LTGEGERYFTPTYPIEIKAGAAEVFGREDAMGRWEYLQMLTADPATGQVPVGIRQAELLFDKKISAQTARLRSQQLVFKGSGPLNVGGRTRAVAFDVRDENVILAGGVSGGIWKSTDGGLTWTRKSDPENRNSVTCIVQDVRPGKEDTWYHGTGEIVGNSPKGGDAPFRGDGIYKSTDNGETWTPIASTQDSPPHLFNSQFQYIWDIEVNPTNLLEDEVLVAAFGGILRSVDGGGTWEVVLGKRLFQLEDSLDLNTVDASFYTALERSENNVFYATLSTETAGGGLSNDAGIYYSLDGQVWEDITPVTSESRYRRVVMGPSPSNPDIVYFMFDSSPVFILEHNLSKVNSPGTIRGFDPKPREIPDFEAELGDIDTQGSYNMMIRVHPTDPNMVFVGATNLYRSTDGFRTKENIKWIGGYDPGGKVKSYLNHHPDQHDLLFFKGNPNRALSASDGGLILTPDITADSVFWESRNDGFITSQFFTLAQSKIPGDPTMLGGMQDNGTFLSPTGEKTWKDVIGGDGSYAATTRENKLWFASFQRGQVLRLTLNEDYEITSFGRVDPGGLVSKAGSIYLFINPFVLDPTNENRMFCAGGNHLYFHPNVSQIPGGSQVPTHLGWEQVTSTPIPDALISAVEISSDGERLFFGTAGGDLFRLNHANDPLAFEVIPLTTLTDGYISSIAINPEDKDHVIVVFSSYRVPSVFESKDGGQSFTNVSGNLEENADGSGGGPSVRWAEIIPKNNGYQVFVGTSIGLFSASSLSTNTVWIKESPDLIGSAVVPMMDYRPTDGRLVVATHGNGVFEAQIPDAKTLEPIDPGGSLADLVILDAFPNPFTEKTTLRYSIPADGEVRIDILTSSGAMVNTILWGPQFKGVNEVVWDGTTPSGFPLSNGIYFYRISYQGISKSGRLLLRR